MIIMKLAGLLSLRHCIPTRLRSVFVCCVVRKFVYRDIDIGMMLCASDMSCTYSYKGESKYFLASKMEIFPSACRGHLSTWCVVGLKAQVDMVNSCQKVQVHWMDTKRIHSLLWGFLIYYGIDGSVLQLLKPHTLEEIQINTIVIHIK